MVRPPNRGASVLARARPPCFHPAMSTPPKPHRQARAERLSAALRENLRRRKAQARGRETAATDEGDPAAEEGTKTPAAGDES